MKLQVKPLLKSLTPPILVPAWRRVAPRPEWKFVGELWPHGDPRECGWEHASIVEAQRRKWPTFVQALSDAGLLGVSHEDSVTSRDCLWAHNAIMAYAYVLARAAIECSQVSVLDWGGGLGHYYAIGCAVLPDTALEHTVVDLPALCSAGRKVLPAVRFETGEGWKTRTYTLVLASGSIQYAREWRQFLRSLVAVAEPWVYLTRVPVVHRSKSFVVSQRPDHAGYRTEYIGWTFNRDELLAELASAGLKLEREFLIAGHSFVARAPEQPRYCGYLFKRRQ